MIDTAVCGDVQPGEETLIEHAAFPVVGGVVEPVAVCRERERGIEQPDKFLLGLRDGGGAGVCLMQLAGEAVHLPFEYVQRNRPGVMGLKQLLALILESFLLTASFGHVARGLLSLACQFADNRFANDGSTCHAQLQGSVEVNNPFFNTGDRDIGTAAGLLLVAATHTEKVVVGAATALVPRKN
ncbi:MULTISPECIES: hypothetical protein [Mycobacteriaceae]|uniref:hypothetical protein n=1 Tax=Mycobacteriaceae TaxID=1762 RepID=UPI0004EF78B7|nr:MULTISPECIES: hypothetical protein [Mycobacteriaceae]AHC27754.2 hypothetical protein D174_25805 [Mycolicibacterium neoaurum VKM Ac-1815D]AMO03863.1 hypothetical protein MyAD_00125 [Mycolicibacterium neoaurum]AXK77882.1 hypothetical protein DXK33_25045 [Mycolicibacterium neoaurum]KJQ48302.1 hypothetical protein TS71_22515 [Mycolicibacterium neoaurum]KUM06486.1 hypothetical protein AVZ31_21635 [Mycolicibacterium neoaurum]